MVFAFNFSANVRGWLHNNLYNSSGGLQMNYQQDRDEAAENFATKNQTAIFIAGNTHQGTLNGFINGSDFGKQWEEERVGPVVEALKAWLEWEREQIKKEGSYVGKRINELIQQGESALKAFEEGK